ncbi:MAG TPA: hypothetical protein PLM16_01710, partial [Candidatus Woesebacteria bacterium]|nr:hypothetical protein [Candidatus Woesebacteria bacterium]
MPIKSSSAAQLVGAVSSTSSQEDAQSQKLTLDSETKSSSSEPINLVDDALTDDSKMADYDELANLESEENKVVADISKTRTATQSRSLAGSVSRRPARSNQNAIRTSRGRPPMSRRSRPGDLRVISRSSLMGDLETAESYDSGQDYDEPSFNELPDAELPTEFIEGVLDTSRNGHGVLRMGFAKGETDAYISSSQMRRFNLRPGDSVRGP